MTFTGKYRGGEGHEVKEMEEDPHAVAAHKHAAAADRTFDAAAAAAEALAASIPHQHGALRSEEHTSELQSLLHLVCRLLLEKKKNTSELQSRLHLVCRLLLEKKKFAKERRALV